MRQNSVFPLAIVVLGIALVPGPIWAETAEQVFGELFGDEARRIAATSDTRDDAAFGARLLASVDSFTGQEDLKALLCQKAHEFSIRDRAGYATALAALGRLASLSPGLKDACDDNSLNVYRLMYSGSRTPYEKGKTGQTLLEELLEVSDGRAESGKFREAMLLCRQADAVASAVVPTRRNEVQARIKWLNTRLALEQSLTAWKNRLAASPQDTATAGKLFWACLVDLDDPSEAVKYAKLACDEATANFVVAAGMSVEGLPQAACLKLAVWYKDLANTDTKLGKEAMLRRAKTYAERFLLTHTEEDVERVKAKLLKDDVEKALAACETFKPNGQGKWIDLIRMVDPVKDAVKGLWRVQDRDLVSDISGFARLKIPYQPPEEYDLQVVFVRETGNEAVALMLAEGKASFAWLTGSSGNKWLGFPVIAGRTAFNNQSERGGSLKNGQSYTVLAQVRKDGVRVFLDDKLVSEHMTNYDDMSIPASWSLPEAGCLGVGSNASPTIFQSIRILEVTGRGKTAR